jgi:hypothetical protein
VKDLGRDRERERVGEREGESERKEVILNDQNV